MVVWVIPRFCTQGHLYKSDIYHSSLFMTFSRSQSYAIDMTFLGYSKSHLEICLMKFRIFLKSYDIKMYISLENVISHKFKRFCHYLPFLEKLKILKFWQIFGKNDTFPKISCYDIFMAFIKKIKNLISVILLPFFNFWDRFFLQLFSIWSWGGGLCQSFSAPGHVTVKNFRISTI